MPVSRYEPRFLETAETADIEGDLARQIQNAVPADRQRRFNRLYAKRCCAPETLTENEHAELLRLTDEIEAHDAERARRLVRLAALRNVGVETALAQSGIKPVAHDWRRGRVFGESDASKCFSFLEPVPRYPRSVR